MIAFFLAGQLVNPTNQRWHWSHRAKWARTWRDRTAAALYAQYTYRDTFQRMRGIIAQGGSLVVDYAPVVSRRLDDDGLVAAFKPIRDEIATLFLTDDGPASRHRWRPGAQVVSRDPLKRGVHITIAVTAREPAPAGGPGAGCAGVA